MAYFLESPSRLANDSYFSRLLDIVRRPEGAPLLKALSEAEHQLAAVFSSKPDAGTRLNMAVWRLVCLGCLFAHSPYVEKAINSQLAATDHGTDHCCVGKAK